MKKHTFLCEEAIKNKQPQKMVDNTSAIARLANRVLLVAKQECDNSEDPHFIDEIHNATEFVQNRKSVNWIRKRDLSFLLVIVNSVA